MWQGCHNIKNRHTDCFMMHCTSMKSLFQANFILLTEHVETVSWCIETPGWGQPTDRTTSQARSLIVVDGKYDLIPSM